MNPGSRPRWGVAAALAALLVGSTTVVVVAGSDSASAAELTPFASCQELASWRPAEMFAATDEDLAADGTAASGEATPAAAPDARAALDAAEGAGGAGDTNVVVEGVDELDVVDRIDAGRALVIAGDRLTLVDLDAGAALASVTVPSDARLTYDPDQAVAWVVGSGRNGTEVHRVRVDATGLAVEATWSTVGWLVDARRTGDRLHVAVVDGYGDGRLPFDGGPVPCEQVLRPAAPTGGEATLLATLPATGALEPLAATEVVGSGQFVHVTPTAAYLATPLASEAGFETSIHRFALDGLVHTGSGRVGGRLVNPFSMSEHDGVLRVALTHGGWGMPFAIADDVAGTGVAVDAAESVSSDQLPPDAPRTRSQPLPVLNEIVALDTDGDLDVLGRTARFGHEGETLQGVRFVGDVAYAVTFLQTDPFYVIDLADPAAPRVVGELELPGFSAYLHPLGDGLVAGFGPDGNGATAVKLFDVADPARPRLVDSIRLGDSSTVVWDHHAFVSLGDGRFAVPAETGREVLAAGCTDVRREQLLLQARQFEMRYGNASEAERKELDRQMSELWSDPCLNPRYVYDSEVVVAQIAGRRLEVSRPVRVETTEPAARVLTREGGWALLTGTRLVLTDGGGRIVADLTLAESPVGVVID